MRAPNLPDCIFLVGFMGSGKSAVGAALAERLGYRLVDTDSLVEQSEGRAIEKIFAEEGEPYFRRREAEALRSLAQEKGVVVATGGGLFQGKDEREWIAAQGVSIWLDAPLETIWERCRSSGGRPLFGEFSELRKLYDSRRGGYARADLRLEVGDKAVAEIAAEIHAWLEQRDA